jgi:tetratricopeptide (TPR) repeat protein
LRPQFATLAVLLSLVAAGTPSGQSAAQTSPMPANATRGETSLRKGLELKKRGHLMDALKAFEEAQTDPSVKAEALLEAAQTHHAMFSRDPAQSIHAEKAIDDYRSAIKIGNPTQQTQAQNNLGILYLKQRDYTNALRAFESMDPNQVLPEDKFIYDYNLGRAYELTGHPNTAYPNYLRSLDANPAFSLAAEKAFNNLRQSEGPPKIDECLRLADRLLGSSQSSLASQEALRCLDIWGNNPSAERLLTVLVRHYVNTSLSPDAFVKDEWRHLEYLASRHHRLQLAVMEVRLAFTGDFKARIQGSLSEPVQPFPEWSRFESRAKSGEKAFPRLLKNIGDFYYQSTGAKGDCRDPEKAIARYAAALSMDPMNTESALFTSAILRDYSSRLDPRHALYDQLVDRIVASDGIDSPQDWANLMKTHFLLGSIFERDKKWGSEGERRSAIFHWSLALRAKDKVRQLDPEHNAPLTPGLNHSLAQAYKAIGRNDDSFDQFLLAARQFKEEGESAASDESLKLASELTNVHMNDQRRTQLASVTRAQSPPEVPALPVSPSGRGLLGSRSLAILLSNTSVQQELKLDDTQVQKSIEVAANAREKMRSVREALQGLEGEERTTKVRELNKEANADANKAIGTFMTGEQIQRLHQIRYQQEGGQAFADEDVQKSLKLTDAQKTEIRTITQEATSEMRELFQAAQADRDGMVKKIIEHRKAMLAKIETKLTDEQKTAWKEMLGAPFEIRFEPRPND